MAGLALRNLVQVRRELDAAANIPYTDHVSEHVHKTRNGDHVLECRLSGASFETADDDQLNEWHERLNALWRNLAGPNLALWTHVIRRREHVYPSGGFRPGFAHDLNAKYRTRLAEETLMVNELYVSLVYRPQATAAGAATLRPLKKADRSNCRVELSDSLAACAKLQQQLLAALDRYDPEPLGVYRHGAGYCSSLLEFLSVLLNGEWQRMPLPRAPINEVLATTRPFFEVEALEYRTAPHTRVCALLGIKEYPTPTRDRHVQPIVDRQLPVRACPELQLPGQGRRRACSSGNTTGSATRAWPL